VWYQEVGVKDTETNGKRQAPIIKHNIDGSSVRIDSGTVIVKRPVDPPSQGGRGGGGAAVINGKFIVIPPR
jgi:hypothetical protein